jgi:carbon monoxide dehydrogenase subunit G
VARVEQRDGGRPVTVVAYAVDLEAPPERVWQVISDPANLPHWDRHIVGVRGVPDGGLAYGVRYAVDMRFMAVHATIRAEVREWDPPFRAKIYLSGLLDATVTSTVEPIGDGRSRLEHVVEYRFGGGALGNVAASSLRLVGGARFALRRGMLAQKREIETGRR